MQIILTHEQADFDALASLLGAALINEGASAVLPRRMNRNVRAFHTLYGADLPFVDSRDLPSDSITHITLVDTQALITLKGVNTRTEVSVIDHHLLRDNIDPAWRCRIDRTGAATTLLVELLQDKAVALNGIHATLLLLGIYEDTGSLAYSSTTPRDVRAVAWLLEQGASLKIAAGYLNPPLSSEQRQLYDLLVSNAQTHTLHDVQIITACVDGRGVSEEISSIAHKIRDLLDPDGLVILVATEEGYRLVMRSTTDRVNVAGLAAHFGGGGHERASAALVQRKPDDPEDPLPRLQEIIADVVDQLPRFIRPAVTVGQIMSRKPRLLSPGTSAAEALEMMQRYGYEGFPVVEGSRVLGLLSRRAVDRAISHKLNLKAASLMEAGQVQVLPTDSIASLQKVMTETGWGQVPVYHPQKEKIIGIVTRTDLLKALGAVGENRHARNLKQQLEDSLPPARLKLLHLITAVAEEQHQAIYVVGGFVRDLILGQPGIDFDIVVEGDALNLARKLSERYGGRLVIHTRFGTAKWHVEEIRAQLLREFNLTHADADGDLPDTLDLISARTEFYEHPTALPTVERSSIKLDLHRRDFSINTLALRLDGRHYGELLDFWGGFNDLQKGVVRVLHSLSFIDDPTRMLRAVRFEQRFGFEIERRTLDLMSEAHGQLRQVTGERLRHEIDLMFAEARPAPVLERAGELGLFTQIQPELTWQPAWTAGLERLLTDQGIPGWQIPAVTGGYPTRRLLGYTYWWMHFTTHLINLFVHKLRIPAPMTKSVTQAVGLRNVIDNLVKQPPSATVDALDNFSMIAQAAVRADLTDSAQIELLDRYQREWRLVQPGVDGNDLRRLGIPAGPQYALILSSIKHAWLDGLIHDPGEEKLLLEKLIADSDPT